MRRQVGDQCYELDCTVRKLNGESFSELYASWLGVLSSTMFGLIGMLGFTIE